jgi:DNA-binding MarR family transcriptional regulator
MPSQRHLSRKLDVSLGLVNSFVKRLAQKGYFKVTHIPKNRVKYMLTPKGAAEKTRLTYEYIKFSYTFYRDARRKIRELFHVLEKKGVRRIVFYGTSDLAEIAYLSLQETSIGLSAIVDKSGNGIRFLGQTVRSPAFLHSLSYDRILITSVESLETIRSDLLADGIKPESIITV